MDENHENLKRQDKAKSDVFTTPIGINPKVDIQVSYKGEIRDNKFWEDNQAIWDALYNSRQDEVSKQYQSALQQYNLDLKKVVVFVTEDTIELRFP